MRISNMIRNWKQQKNWNEVFDINLEMYLYYQMDQKCASSSVTKVPNLTVVTSKDLAARRKLGEDQ